MIYPQPTASDGSNPPVQPISAQNEWLLSDMTSLRILVVLNVCSKATSPTLVEMLNRDRPVKVEIESVESCLARLEQSGYIRGQHYIRRAIFWQQELKAPYYSITNMGKVALSEGLAALNSRSR